jgi:host factor-I protein
MAFRGSNHDQSSRPSKNAPPEDTHQEAVYLKMLGEKQQPVQIKLRNGDVVSGWIEYYDRRMVRLTREGAPNLFIFKHDIAYIAEDGGRKLRPGGAPGTKTGNLASASE